ncbi:MAG: hypothetical protein KKA63_03980 [Gammaproteobacteria bacterium]|nr:hypothetical protein [Gammaproteobacteria bacterium]MDD2929449.1 hypothetical protein [Sideroxydans sp.]MDD5471322.1 hypothetical protein [Sideroxydans sp.]
MSDKVYYQIISDELASNKTDPAIWTQALAISDADIDKTKAAYIRLRYRDLLRTPSLNTVPATNSNPIQPSFTQGNTELDRLRAELKRKLAITKKSSLYITLGLGADASDATVASTIAEREVDNQIASATSISEFNYAKRVLGDPSLREQYDRKLLESVNNEMTRRNNLVDYEDLPKATTWLSGHKGSVVIGVLSLVLLGYLGLDFFKAKNSHSIQKEVVDIQRDFANATTETDRVETYADIDIKQSAAEIAMERQRQEYELRTRTLDQQRYEQERRYETEQERLRLQREQAEERRLQQEKRAEEMSLQKEKRYWSCVNQQLTIPNVTTHAAYSRCGAYR